jgi:hypothetical protein
MGYSVMRLVQALESGDVSLCLQGNYWYFLLCDCLIRLLSDIKNDYFLRSLVVRGFPFSLLNFDFIIRRLLRATVWASGVNVSGRMLL